MDHGIQAEDNLEQICHRMFGCDFVLRSPVLVEESGEKELADVLIFVDDTIIIFQSKSLSMDIDEIDTVKFKRIRKKYDDAKKQLNTALNAHARGATVRAKTPLDISFEIPWKQIKRKIGVVTLNLQDNLYGDPEFRFQFPSLVETHKDICVHTFMLPDLLHMTNEISTPADFIQYTESRELAFLRDNVTVGNELDFLAFFKTNYPLLEKAFTDPLQRVVVLPGTWEGYVDENADKIAERYDRLKSSKLIDILTREFHKSIEYGVNTQGLSPKQCTSCYLEIIGMLGRLSRVERAFLGDKILEKIEKTETAPYGYFLGILAETAYVFLFSNEPNRTRRQEFMLALGTQACHRVSTKQLIAIASLGAQLPGRSFDAVVLDVEETKKEYPIDPTNRLFGPPKEASRDEWSK